MYRKFVYLILLAFLALSTNAQRKLDFQRLSIDDGFTSSRANTIIQDRKGFIWIGTWNGLNRYDGYQCKIYRPSYHDSTTISNREVVELLEDHSGNIWIGTSSGLNCLNPSTEQLKRFEFENRIISLYEDHENIIWIGTWNAGLYKLDPASGQIDHFLTNDIISDIYEDSRNILWLATYNGLVNFDRNTGGYVRYLPNNEHNSISHTVVTQIIESNKGNLWVGTWGGGLNKVIVHPNKDETQFIHYKNQSRANSLSSNVVYRVYYDAYGNLWAGTWDGGLNLLEPDEQIKDPKEASFYICKNDLSDPYSISGNNITALFVDRSGVLWVGSSNIDRASITKTGITRYKTNQIVNGRYIDKAVRSFGKDGNNVLVGTTKDVLQYKKINDSYKMVKSIENLSYSYHNQQFTTNSVLSILKNYEGLWVGTEDAGLLFFKNETPTQGINSTYRFLNSATSPALPGDKICSVVESKKLDNVYWIGTQEHGFAKLTYQNNQFSVTNYQTGKTENTYSDTNIRAMLEDRNGKLWIGTQSGLNYYDPASGNFQQFYFSIDDTSSINDNVINVLLEDYSGNLWIGTNSGLNKKVEKKEPDGSTHISFMGYPNVKYLGNEIINNILVDDDQKLWLSLYRGMIQFDPDSEIIRNQYFNKDFQNVIINRGAALKGDDGTFFLGGGNGFLSFHPDNLFKNSFPPKVCITDLQIYNESFDDLKQTVKRYKNPEAISYTNSVNLSYKDAMLTFVFSAMDFKNPDKNKYTYFLDGFDKQWNEVGSRNTATYTSIPPGNYTFRVKAANNDGVWSQEPATLQVHISPPWWKTIWAYIAYIIIILGLLYFFKEYSIVEATEKGKLAIEHMKNEEEHRLNELKSQFFTDVTHEFRTPLTLILGPAKELVNNTNLDSYSSRQAELIKKNAHKLLQLVNQLMEFRKVEKGRMELLPQKTNIIQLIDGLYDSFKPMAESKEIDFRLNYRKQEILINVDVEKFEKIIYNLVSNAFKYTEDGGQISINVDSCVDTKLGKSLIIEVEDTGIGIAEENKDRVFERFFQANQKRTQSTGGIGLYLTKNLVELHSGVIELESELGKGSLFRVTIPDNNEEHQSSLSYQEPSDNNRDQDAANQNEEDQAEKTQTAEKKNAPTILIAEDDEDLNEFLVSGLSNIFNVIATFNGKEALEQAHKQNIDIILTDIMMPELDGFELCKILRKDLSTSHIPVVFLTAKTMKEDEIKGLKLGAVDYVYKPFNLVSLRLKIQNILENRKHIHERMRANQIMEPETIELSSLDEIFLKEAVEAVNKHLDDSTFDVEKFSQEIGISTNQAYRKIKALTGQTAKEFIRNQRLKIAASLLVQKKRSISEIIYMVGFSSPSYFTRCFKEYYGCTPKEYMENAPDNDASI